MAQGVSEVVEGVDIGEGGISFNCDMVLDFEHEIIVNFFLPGGEFFSVRATLRNAQNRSNHFVYGASFDSITIALKRQIRAYVARTSSVSAP